MARRHVAKHNGRRLRVEQHVAGRQQIALLRLVRAASVGVPALRRAVSSIASSLIAALSICLLLWEFRLKSEFHPSKLWRTVAVLTSLWRPFTLCSAIVKRETRLRLLFFYCFARGPPNFTLVRTNTVEHFSLHFH